jgi:hypothetical protein
MLLTLRRAAPGGVKKTHPVRDKVSAGAAL